jgi:O-succinylbenzoic acid--CoA ligase
MQDWLAARAIASPEQLAITAADIHLSYRELNELVAQHVVILEDHKQKRIALPARSTYLSTILAYALLRLGKIIVPLNTRLTEEEMLFQIKNVKSKLAVYAASSFEDMERIPPEGLITHGIFEGATEDMDREYFEPYLSSEISLSRHLAIIHSSGTSGKPKGVVLSYGNFFYSAVASASRIGHLPNDKWLCVLPLYHVGGLSILLRAAIFGFTVDLRPKFDVDEINHALSYEDITLISLVPTMLYRLLESGTPEKWKSLRLILLGGAAASKELLEECRARNLPVATTYGLTEAASQVATALPHEVYAKIGTVGKPLMFTQVKIVAENGNPQKTGDYGEILVKSPMVMQGYYNNPEATAKALREGWLHTGDIGYLDKDGDLFLVQRRSDLIVSGGENVYPAEIEAVLRQHPAVKEAVIVGLDDAEWGQKVAAAILLREGQNVGESDIMSYARQQLAGYKIPRLIKFVSEFPMTGSGKIQRGAVRDLFGKS